ncbi:MAG TPA: flavin reductase [Novosphingobium sp.]|nr:flavin reductase [Novosphingobium sp.]
MSKASDFREALGSFVTGVTIVTASDGAGRDVGVTASSFNSVSLDPPMVLWSLARNSSSLTAFEAASHFAVHILAADQEELSNRFAKTSADKFAGLELGRGAGGVPLLAGAAAQFQCRTAFQYDGGDHVIFVGEVEAFERSRRPPLAFHGGRYALAARKAADLSAGDRAEPESGTFGEDFLGYLLGRAHFQVYAPMLPVLERLGLTPNDHFVLSTLGGLGEAPAAQVDAAIGPAGQHFAAEDASSLAARGLVTAGPSGALALTEAGRAKFVELTAAAMAIEDDAAEVLDESEIALLRHLLKRLITGA